MLVDNDTRIKYKDGFISRVYYQDNIVYEDYVDLSVMITIGDDKGWVRLYDSNFSDDIARVNFAPYRKQLGPQQFEWVKYFEETYKVKRGSIISFKWSTVDNVHYGETYTGLDPTGTVMNSNKLFIFAIYKKA